MIFSTVGQHYGILLHTVSHVPKWGRQDCSVVCSDTGRGRSAGRAGKRLTASWVWAMARTPGLSEGISRAASSGKLGCDLVLRWTEGCAGGGWDGALEEGRRCQNFKRGSIRYVYSSKSLTRIRMYWTEGFDFVYGEFIINVHKCNLSQNTRKYASSVRSWEMQSSLVSNQHCQLKCYLHDSGRNVQCCSPFLPPSPALSWKLQQWATKWKSVTWGKTSLSLTLSAKCFSMCLATVSLDVVTYMGLGYWTTNSLNPAPLNTLTS